MKRHKYPKLFQNIKQTLKEKKKNRTFKGMTILTICTSTRGIPSTGKLGFCDVTNIHTHTGLTDMVT